MAFHHFRAVKVLPACPDCKPSGEAQSLFVENGVDFGSNGLEWGLQPIARRQFPAFEEQYRRYAF